MACFSVLCEINIEGNAFFSWAWSWVPRVTNEAEDFITSHAGAEMCNFVWVIRPSSSFVRILNKDGFPCPLF